MSKAKNPAVTFRRGLPIANLEGMRIMSSGVELYMDNWRDIVNSAGTKVTSPQAYKEGIERLVDIVNTSDRDPRMLLQVTVICGDDACKLHCYVNMEDLYIKFYSLENSISGETSHIYTINEGDEKYHSDFSTCNISTKLLSIQSIVTAGADWIKLYTASSYRDSIDLIHALGVYVAEAMRFLPMKLHIANSIEAGLSVALDAYIFSRSGTPLYIKSSSNCDILASYVMMIRNWLALSSSCPENKATRVFSPRGRENLTSFVVTVMHPSCLANKGRSSGLTVSNTNTPDRAGCGDGTSKSPLPLLAGSGPDTEDSTRRRRAFAGGVAMPPRILRKHHDMPSALGKDDEGASGPSDLKGCDKTDRPNLFSAADRGVDSARPDMIIGSVSDLVLHRNVPRLSRSISASGGYVERLEGGRNGTSALSPARTS
jgi:hypothetical protein